MKKEAAADVTMAALCRRPGCRKPLGNALVCSACGEDHRGPMTWQPGWVLQGYRLIEVIGKGGMGEVWKVCQEDDETILHALKLIKTDAAGEAMQSLFMRERQLLVSINHTNVARVHRTGTAPDGQPYFVMDLVEAEGRQVDLLTFCDQHGLGIRERLKLFIKVCDAAHYLHRRSIVHRDLKPSNILVSYNGDLFEPKIIDFGLAKLAGSTGETDGPAGSGSALHSQPGKYKGTPTHSSPEQFGDAATVGPASDVYSLGVILVQLLIGRLPLHPDEQQLYDEQTRSGKFSNELMASLREKTRPALAALIDDMSVTRQRERTMLCGAPSVELGSLIDEDLHWIVAKALQHKLAARYSSALLLAQDIQHCEKREPVSARRHTRTYLTRRFVQRHTAASIAAAFAVMSLVAGLVMSLLFLGDAKVAADLAKEKQGEAEQALRDKNDETAKKEREAAEKEEALKKLAQTNFELTTASAKVKDEAAKALAQKSLADEAKQKADASAKNALEQAALATLREGEANERKEQLRQQQTDLLVSSAARHFALRQDRHGMTYLLEALRMSPERQEARVALLSHLVYQPPAAPLAGRFAAPVGDNDVVFSPDGRKAFLFAGSKGVLLKLPQGEAIGEPLLAEHGFSNPFFLSDNRTLVTTGGGGDGAGGYSVVTYWDTASLPVKARHFPFPGYLVMLEPHEREKIMIAKYYEQFHDERNYIGTKSFPLNDLSEKNGVVIGRFDAGDSDDNTSDIETEAGSVSSPSGEWYLALLRSFGEPEKKGLLQRLFKRETDATNTPKFEHRQGLFKRGESKPRFELETGSSACFSSDDRHLVVVREDRITYRELSSGKVASTVKLPSEVVFDQSPVGIKYDATSGRFGAADEEGGVWIWKRDNRTGKVWVTTLDLDITGSNQWTFGPGETVLSWDDAGRRYVWDFSLRPNELLAKSDQRKAKEATEFREPDEEHDDTVVSAEWQPLPRRLYSGAEISVIKKCPDGQHVMVLWRAGYAALWAVDDRSLRPSRAILTKTLPEEPPVASTFSGDGRLVFVDEPTAGWSAWEVKPQTLRFRASNSPGVNGVSHDGSVVLAAGRLFNWDAAGSGYVLSKLMFTKGTEEQVSPTGHVLSFRDGSYADDVMHLLQVWHPPQATPVLRKNYKATPNPNSEYSGDLEENFRLGPNGDTVLRWREDGLVELLEGPQATPRWSQFIKGADLSHEAFLPKSQMILMKATGGDNSLILLDEGSGRQTGIVRTFEDFGRVRVSEDETLIVSASDETMGAWKLPSLERTLDFKRSCEPWQDHNKTSGHASQEAGINELVLSKDGSLALMQTGIEHSGTNLDLSHLGSELPLVSLWIQEGVSSLSPLVTTDEIVMVAGDGRLLRWRLPPAGSEPVPDLFVEVVQAVLGMRLEKNRPVEVFDQSSTIAPLRERVQRAPINTVYDRVAAWLLGLPLTGGDPFQ